MLRRQPIARQIIALVTAAVLATAGAMVAITFIGPPPRPAPTQLSDVAQALGGESIDRIDTRPLRQEASATEPEARTGEMRDRGIEQWLAKELGTDPESLRAFTTEPPPPGPGARRENGLRGEGSFGWQHDGRWRIVRVDPAPAALPWWATVATVTTLVLGAIIALAWLSARTITRPLERLASHVRGDGADLPLVGDDDAPPEVAIVAGALASFQRAQLDLVAQRTRILSAIAHDMGSPLARLAFRIEALPEPQRDAAQAEIAAMRRLIEDSLALDRSGSEPAERFDLAELAAAMVEECQLLGQPVEAANISPMPIVASQLALRRLIQNVIDNAVRYGGGARVGLSREENLACLAVRDCGPGFSAEMLEFGCQPFVRGEVSRNPATGGSGLGLAIAAAIAKQHMGSLELRNGASGGGVVLLHLPLAPD
jgi:signal transduction histidine kinase